MKYQSMLNEGKFVKVMCNKCNNVQVIYGRASSLVKCLKCSAILAEPKSSKAKIKARVLSVIK